MKGKGFGKVEALEDFPVIPDIKSKNKKFMEDIKDAREYVKILGDNGATNDEIIKLLNEKGFKNGKAVLDYIGGKKKKKGGKTKKKRSKNKKKKGGKRSSNKTKKKRGSKKKRSKK